MTVKFFFFFNKVSPCDSKPCENGGECSNVGDSFNCKCPPGYRGKRCQNEGMEEISVL